MFSIRSLRFSYTNRDFIDLWMTDSNVTTNPSFEIRICKNVIFSNWKTKNVIAANLVNPSDAFEIDTVLNSACEIARARRLTIMPTQSPITSVMGRIHKL
jgi:hypothetical protein